MLEVGWEVDLFLLKRKMKKILIAIAAIAATWLIGYVIGRQHFRDATKMPQRDTVTVYDTARYSRLELVSNTYKLDIPKIGVPELVYIPSDSTTIIYRDSVRYVTLPRQFFYTRTADAEVYHSGIDSRIDALNVFHKTQTITKTVTQSLTNRNALTFGIEPSYLNTLSIPIYLEYERMLHKNVGIYGQIAYDLPSKSWGVGIGAKFSVGW